MSGRRIVARASSLLAVALVAAVIVSAGPKPAKADAVNTPGGITGAEAAQLAPMAADGRFTRAVPAPPVYSRSFLLALPRGPRLESFDPPAGPLLPFVDVSHYSGRSHVWIPALGIDRRVHMYSCSRGQPPENLVFQWGCAGKNNIYLFGHAYGVFKALHDVYVRGQLKHGMVVVYADTTGRVRVYRVTEWRIVHPTDSLWAVQDQFWPSMTLQTCVGANSEWRLNVRLVADHDTP
jgi:hypothetical protein